MSQAQTTAKRGRPRKKPLPLAGTEAAAEKPAAGAKRREELHGQRRRRKATPYFSNLRLTIPERLQNNPNYHYLWALDKPGRLESLTKDDDYDFVEDGETSGDERNSGIGTRIERHGGIDKFGNPLRHYLLRKPMKYHLEDQKEKRAKRDKRMAAIKRGRLEDGAGNELQAVDENGQPIGSDGIYVSRRGISITHGDYQP